MVLLENWSRAWLTRSSWQGLTSAYVGDTCSIFAEVNDERHFNLLRRRYRSTSSNLFEKEVPTVLSFARVALPECRKCAKAQFGRWASDHGDERNFCFSNLKKPRCWLWWWPLASPPQLLTALLGLLIQWGRDQGKTSRRAGWLSEQIFEKDRESRKWSI